MIGVFTDGSRQINEWTDAIINAAFMVHSRLGPGLLEQVYRKCPAYGIQKAGLKTIAEAPVSLGDDQLIIDGAYRLDILVEDTVVVEIKAVERVLPVHHSQLLTYLKLDSKPVRFFQL